MNLSEEETLETHKSSETKPKTNRSSRSNLPQQAKQQNKSFQQHMATSNSKTTDWIHKELHGNGKLLTELLV